MPPSVSRLRLLLALAATCLATAAPAATFDDIYVLGDSLSDQGNLFQATQALTGTGLPASDHYFNGRFSNGEIYAGRLAQGLGLSLTASSAGGNNFAYGGARTAYNTVENPPTAGGLPPGLYPWTLNLERQAFETRQVHNPNALYVVFSGSNDIGDLVRPSLLGGVASTDAQSKAAVQGIVNVVDAFKAAGARYVLVPDIPDLGLIPSVTRLNPPGQTFVSATATALSQRFNTELDTALDQVTGVKIIRFDTFGFLHEVVADPSAFGLANVTSPCYSGFVAPASATDTVCGSPSTSAFWDAEHPTAALHAAIAGRMLEAVNVATVPEPQTWALMVVGLALLAAATRRRQRHGDAGRSAVLRDIGHA